MSTDLTLANIYEIEKQQADKDFDIVVSNNYLPRLQLMTAASDIVKKGDFPSNHYALVTGGNMLDLGKTVDCKIIAMRYKAMSLGEDTLVSFDPAEKLFEEIMARASQDGTGNMYGPEFLVYIPDSNKFATFFMASKTARNESGAVKDLIGKDATLDSKEFKRKYTWYGPRAYLCATTLADPDPTDLATEYNRFKNPPKSEVEVAEDTTSRER